MTAKEGRADEVQVLLAAIRKNAESDAEKGCLTYRTCRGEGPDERNNFLVFEEYDLPSGIVDHVRSLCCVPVITGCLNTDASCLLVDGHVDCFICFWRSW